MRPATSLKLSIWPYKQKKIGLGHPWPTARVNVFFVVIIRPYRNISYTQPVATRILAYGLSVCLSVGHNRERENRVSVFDKI